MARRGENIRKRSDGRWEGRYLIHINGSKKYRSVYAPSYNEVKQKLFNSKKESEITLLSQKEQTAPLNASADMSLDEIGQLWLIYIKDNRKYSTYRKYANIYDMHIRDIFGSLTADELSLEIIEKALPKEMSASLYKSIYCVLNQILSYGNRYCGTPKIHLKVEKLRTVPKTVQTINATDQQKLCRYLLSDLDSCKLGILICLYMGLRLGEICALKWEDIDFQRKTIHINRTVQRIQVGQEDKKTILYEGPPKTLCSVREIPIPEFLFPLLLSYKDDGVYVLNKFSPMEPRTYQYKFYSYLNKAYIEVSLSRTAPYICNKLHQ